MNRLRTATCAAALLASSALPASAAPARVMNGAPAHHSGGPSTARQAGEIIGFVGLVGVLVAWTEGYGLLGGRTRRRGQEPVGPPPDKDEA